MRVIGLTGGIASGKSTVAHRFAEHGAAHIDADLLARQAVEPGTEALEQIRAEFGGGVFAADGALDRPALGRMVFGDSEALQRLNGIVHPAVRVLASERIADAVAGNARVVVYDVPLLVEGEIQPEIDTVVVVHADRDTRLARLMRLRGMSREGAVARIDAQATDAERLEIADVVIDAGASVEHTIEQVDRLWDRLTTP